jgi:hypothetical protein
MAGFHRSTVARYFRKRLSIRKKRELNLNLVAKCDQIKHRSKPNYRQKNTKLRSNQRTTIAKPESYPRDFLIPTVHYLEQKLENYSSFLNVEIKSQSEVVRKIEPSATTARNKPAAALERPRSTNA